MQQDVSVARYFLDIIHEDLPGECRAVWLGGETRPLPAGCPKSVTLNGQQDGVLERLADYNAQGYDVFFVPGEVSAARLAAGKPARNCDIVATNWLCVDIDTDPGSGELTNLGRLQEADLEPTIIIQTSLPLKLQAFWQVDTSLEPDEAAAINKALAKKLGGDPQATNAARLFRVPGFLHRKAQQTGLRAQIVGGTNYGYSAAAIRKWVGIGKRGKGKAKSPRGKYFTSVEDRATDVKYLPASADQKRLEAMRKAHAAQRATDRKTSPIKRTRQPNPLLPAPLAHALKNCETADEYADTLRRLWPRTPGCRHMLALASGVELYRFGLTLEAARAVVKSACEGAGDQERTDRLRAATDAYRAAQRGQRVTGTGSGAPMTVFSAEHFGPALNTLPASERSAERRRRVVAVLEGIKPTEAGLRECSCRTLAERTGVSKDAVSRTLVDLEAEGAIKRVRLGVVLCTASTARKPSEAPEAPETDKDSPTANRVPQTPSERLPALFTTPPPVQEELRL